MAGLTNPIRALPFGYNSKDNFPAVEKFPPALPTNAYNRDALPQAPWLRKRTPIATPGIPWPSARRQDDWNNVNAKTGLSPILENYNTNPVPYPPGAKQSPETIPWSKEYALAVLTASEGAGNIQPPKTDMLAVAKVFLDTTSDPAEKDIWERLVNSLAQLDAIAQSRPLNPAESKKQEDIKRQISDKSQNAPLAIDAPVRAPKPVPATAADIAALIAGMQRQRQQPQVQQPQVPLQPLQTP